MLSDVPKDKSIAAEAAPTGMPPNEIARLDMNSTEQA
jgi:hypothetical protein